MRFFLALAVGLALGSLGQAGVREFALQVGAGTMLGYAGGLAGAWAGAALANLAGWSLIDGILGPIWAGYVGYAVGATLGAWTGVIGVEFRLEVRGDPWMGLLGAGFGTGLAFLVASVTDWEWALWLGAPFAALGATFAFTLALPTPP